MHSSARHVADVLRERGVTGQVRELPDPAPTAATAAAQLGCEAGAIANSLVFSADGAPLLVLTSGAHRVDTGKVAALVGGWLVLLNRDPVRVSPPVLADPGDEPAHFQSRRAAGDAVSARCGARAMPSKFASPLLGYNNNVRHKGRVFHIQTEDSGAKYGHVITHLFMDGGRILKSVKSSYAEHVGTVNTVPKLARIVLGL